MVFLLARSYSWIGGKCTTLSSIYYNRKYIEINVFVINRPVSRDCLMYAVAVVSLIVTLQDGIVMWYEALILVLIYMMYIAGKISFEIFSEDLSKFLLFDICLIFSDVLE